MTNFAIVGKLAYRFVPLDEGGQPGEGSRYTLVSADNLQVGDRIEQTLFGHDTWEVVEPLTVAGPLASARDASGADIPLAGTVICRAVG
jgi:hypothetical protein